MIDSPAGGSSEGSQSRDIEVHDGDAILVGSGVAGLSAALELARRLPDRRILLLTHGQLGGHGASPLAQGGVAVALDPADSPELHAQDTEEAAAGLAFPSLVRILTREGPARVQDLISMGARFDRTPSGGLLLGLEGAHSRKRILHASGDRTGAEVTRALRDAVRSTTGIRVFEGMQALDLVVDSGCVRGVLAHDREGRLHLFSASATLLATGGPGRAYLRTTSPAGLNGDGLAMAARAGARLRDLEFVQFHPTALRVDTDPLPLVTEALRGAGARLVDAEGTPIIDPSEGDELAPRDLVARAIWSRMREGKEVFLDARESPGEKMSERFPGAHSLCTSFGIDPVHDLIPVTPATHYHMGGIAVDAEGRTSVPGLWAAGETAASGLHGANRLASNSLLEGLVFGPRAGESIARALPNLTPREGRNLLGETPGEGYLDPAVRLPDDVELQIRTILWEKVGVVRDEAGLRSAVDELDALEDRLAGELPPHARNLLFCGRLIARAALQRRESIGSHFRSDYPEPAESPRHSTLYLEPSAQGGIEASLSPA